jgi:hypothetical protein
VRPSEAVLVGDDGEKAKNPESEAASDDVLPHAQAGLIGYPAWSIPAF